MVALDTNILVRFLVADDEMQTQKVYGIFKHAETDKTQLFVSQLVLLETIWVLESAYDRSRVEIINAIESLILLPFLKFEKHDAIHNFISSSKSFDFDLSDMLIAYSAKYEKCDAVLTFDKKASKHELFELVV